MRRVLRVVTYLSLALLAACNISLPQQSQLKNLKKVPSMQTSVRQYLQKNDLFTEGDWPNKKWWLVYKSSELNRLIEEALQANPTIQAFQSRITVAQQEAIVTGSVLFPLVFFNAKENRQYLSKNGLYRALNHKFPLSVRLVDLSLSFNYEFDFWAKNHHLLYEALGKEMAQCAEAAEVELLTTTALTQAYIAYQTNLIRKTLYAQLVTVRKNIANLQNLVFAKGLSSNLPTFSTTEGVFEAKKRLASIINELADNKHLINILAGRGPESPLETKQPLLALPSSLRIPKTLMLDLIARRPDLMAQIWRAKALAYKTSAAMAEYYPNVNLIGLIGLESVGWKHLFDISSGTAALRPAIHLPIFTAGAIGANIKASHAEFDAAIHAYNNLLLRSTQEILDALAFARDIYTQKKEQMHIINLVNDRYNLVKLRQQKGLDSQFAVYILQEELIQEKLINISLLYNQYLASIKLTKALGGGYYQAKVPLVQKT